MSLDNADVQKIADLLGEVLAPSIREAVAQQTTVRVEAAVAGIRAEFDAASTAGIATACAALVEQLTASQQRLVGDVDSLKSTVTAQEESLTAKSAGWVTLAELREKLAEEVAAHTEEVAKGLTGMVALRIEEVQKSIPKLPEPVAPTPPTALVVDNELSPEMKAAVALIQRDILGPTLESIQKGIKDQIDGMGVQCIDHAVATGQALENKLSEVAAAIEVRLEASQTATTGQITAVTEKLLEVDAAFAETTKLSELATTEVQNELKQVISEIETRLTGLSESTDKAVKAVADSVTGCVSAAVKQVEADIERSAEVVAQLATEHVDTVQRLLSLAEGHTATAGQLAGLEESLPAAIKLSLDARLPALSEDVGAQVAELVAAELPNLLVQARAHASGALPDLLEGMTAEIAAAVGPTVVEQATQVAREIAEETMVAAGAAAKAVAKTTADETLAGVHVLVDGAVQASKEATAEALCGLPVLVQAQTQPTVDKLDGLVTEVLADQRVKAAQSAEALQKLHDATTARIEEAVAGVPQMVEARFVPLAEEAARVATERGDALAEKVYGAVADKLDLAKEDLSKSVGAQLSAHTEAVVKQAMDTGALAGTASGHAAGTDAAKAEIELEMLTISIDVAATLTPALRAHAKDAAEVFLSEKLPELREEVLATAKTAGAAAGLAEGGVAGTAAALAAVPEVIKAVDDALAPGLVEVAKTTAQTVAAEAAALAQEAAVGAASVAGTAAGTVAGAEAARAAVPELLEKIEAVYNPVVLDMAKGEGTAGAAAFVEQAKADLEGRITSVTAEAYSRLGVELREELSPVPLVKEAMEQFKGLAYTAMEADVQESVENLGQKLWVQLTAKLQGEVDRIPTPRDGKPGKDGTNGKDGTDGKNGKITPAVPYVEGRMYERGDWVAHGNGVWCAGRATEEVPGVGRDWDCLLSGVDKMEALLQEDGRTVELHVQMSNGELTKHALGLPIPITRGVYNPELAYGKKDLVTFDGSWWEAMKSGKLGRPGTLAEEWKLTIKRGQNGKDFKPATPPETPNLYKGQWEDKPYQQGDQVDHAGLRWMATRSTRERPPFTTLMSNASWTKIGA